ncbi:GNAT family N-acetyltransferase [Flagellimonas marinaquae]|nr:GNAT family N-acetyltransferase [Allomuricauda aquimarina]
MKRLEKCFDIEFRSYFGEITETEYNNLFIAFQEMIENRFSQKGVEHEGLKRWNEYKNNVFELILQQKACLNVVLERNRPISMSLAFCHQNICVSAITSYDIDYYKFGLGQTHMVKCIEWCLENGFERYDMMWGELPYKNEWSNDTYFYNDHVLYVGDSLISRIKANMVVLAAKIKKKKFYSRLIDSSQKFSKTKNSSTEEGTMPKYEVREIGGLDEVANFERLQEEELDALTFLKRPLCEFQYINSEHYSSINVYKSDDFSYIIEGKSIKIVVTFL